MYQASALLLVLFVPLIMGSNVLPTEWTQRAQEGKMLIATTMSSTFMPYVGNGFIATTINSDAVYLSGLFNGPASGQQVVSHRARIPSQSSITVSGNDVHFIGSAMDLERAIYYTRYWVSGSSVGYIETRSFAHYLYRFLMVFELESNLTSSATVDLLVNNGTASSDLDLQSIPVSGNIIALNGTIVTPEEGSSSVEIPFPILATVSDEVPSSLSLPAGDFTQRFISVYRTSLENFTNETPFEVALADYKMMSTESAAETLLPSHIAAWQSVWQSRIEVGGNVALAASVNASMLYILQSIRADWPWSLSPGGLASNSYNGHSFWDAETWMYPPLALQYPSLAKATLQYRFNHIEGALLKAASYTNNSYRGTMFPWESAYTGQPSKKELILRKKRLTIPNKEEVCPLSAPTGQFEQHISGDIAYAVWQLWMLSNDTTWLREIGYPLLSGIAEFWTSRVSKSGNGSYSILGVIPPDEYHFGDDSVYTNVIASMSLRFAAEAAEILNVSSANIQVWRNIAANLVILFNTTEQIHPEFAGYKGDLIKQADVVLLGFPLMFNMSATVRQNDLVYYSARTDPNGPAMTWGMHCIAYLELGLKSAADSLFPRAYGNIQQPFNVWTETPTGGATNFITGAGGFLQSVLNGYGGIRITETALTFYPQLPPNTTSIKFTNIGYQNENLTFEYNSANLFISTSARQSLLSVCVNQGSCTRLSTTPSQFPIGKVSVALK